MAPRAKNRSATRPAPTRPPAPAHPARALEGLLAPIAHDDGARELPSGHVERPRLVERLKAAAERSVTLIVAPAGYGKTALIAEWERSDDRPFVRLALEDADNDPERLAGRLGRALQQALARRPRAGSVALAEAPEARGPYVLVLDDLHVLHARGSVALVQRLVGRIPRPSQLVLVSRRPPPLPLGRLRAQRALAELRRADLAFTGREAGAFLRDAGVTLRHEEHDAVMSRSEGWPAALYLGVLALRERPARPGLSTRFAGDGALIAPFLREEVLDGLDPDDRDFLIRASVLDSLAGPACDATLGRGDSARTIARLARSTQLLVALHPAERGFGWSPLLREMLRGELRLTAPAEERALHRRASDWHIAKGDRGAAISHALAAGDMGRAATLLSRHAGAYVTRGGNEELGRLLAAFDTDAVAADPRLALAAALSDLAAGRQARAQQWAVAAHRRLPADDGAALLEAVVEECTLDDLRMRAARARRRAGDSTPLRSAACLLEGVALHLTGRSRAARERLEEGARAAALDAPAVQALCLAQLALLAADAGDWDTAAVDASRASAQLAHYRLDGYPTAALVFATAALVHASRGLVAAAREHSQRSQAALRELGDFVPWYAAAANATLARALVRTGDIAEARAHAAGAVRAGLRVPKAPTLAVWVEAAQRELGSAVDTKVSESLALTNAEMRVLRFLSTHLSFREIAAQLYVSTNTVKTQAHAVYRKLHVSSRSAAVKQATKLGLLDVAAAAVEA